MSMENSPQKPEVVSSIGALLAATTSKFWPAGVWYLQLVPVLKELLLFFLFPVPGYSPALSAVPAAGNTPARGSARRESFCHTLFPFQESLH